MLEVQEYYHQEVLDTGENILLPRKVLGAQEYYHQESWKKDNTTTMTSVGSRAILPPCQVLEAGQYYTMTSVGSRTILPPCWK